MMNKLFLLLFTALLSSSVHSTEDVSIDNVIKVYSIKHDIEYNVALAVMTHESGDPRQKMKINPWAVNLSGRSFYPKTRKAAYSLIVKHLANGASSAGIGVGQIEWGYHQQSFNSIWEALSPKINIDVSLKYLSKQMSHCNENIHCAIARYHNKDKIIGNIYLQKVLKVLRNIEYDV